MSSVLLPIPPSFKVTPRAVYVGEPKQLLDLLATGVATPILETTRTKANMPLHKLKLRCKTLFQGNLDVYFLLDYPNQSLVMDSVVLEGKAAEVLVHLSSEEKPVICQDVARANKFAEHLDEVLNFWVVLMDAEVRKLRFPTTFPTAAAQTNVFILQVQKVYPDKRPIQVDRFANEQIISLKPNVFGSKVFDLAEFLALCNAKNGTPCIKVSYGWVSSKEDPRSEEHMWGFKFELSPYPQYPVYSRAKKTLSSAEKQEEIKKKRTRELAEEEVIAEVPIESK